MDFSTNKPEAKCHPRFYTKSVEVPFLSEKEGRPVFEEVEMVEVIIPGDSRTIPHFRVNAEHKARWREQYAAFKEGREAPAEGTPVEDWPPAGPAWVDMLRSHKVRTVEQLAQLSDAQVQAIGMGGLQLRDRAKAWLESAAGMKPVAEALARAEAAEAKVADLQRQFDELKAATAHLKAPEPAPVSQEQAA